MKNNQLLLKKKTILLSLFIICDVVDVSSKLNLCNILKVFGRVDWDFISSHFQKFGFGEKFICMIKVAYTDIQSKIKINGLLSDLLPLCKGVARDVHSQWCCILL